MADEGSDDLVEHSADKMSLSGRLRLGVLASHRLNIKRASSFAGRVKQQVQPARRACAASRQREENWQRDLVQFVNLIVILA